MAEDIGAAPIWVFNNGILSLSKNLVVTDLYHFVFQFCQPYFLLCAGISHNDEVETASIMPFVQV